MAEVELSKYEARILKKLQELIDEGYFNKKDKNLVLNNNFAMLPVQPSIGSGINIGKATPAISVISKDTGRIYYFALKIILPDVFKEAFGNE